LRPLIEGMTKGHALRLVDDLEYIVGYLVRKDSSARDAYKKLKELEDSLASKLTQLWQGQSAAATKVMVDYLKKYGKQLTETHAQAAAAGLKLYMGKGFVKATKDEDLVSHIFYSYDMVGKQTAKVLDVPYAFTFVDKNMMTWLDKDFNFWIGNFYNTFIQDAVTLTVQEYAINQGQNAWTTGQRIKDVINGQYEIPPKYLPGSYIRAEAYWQGLATNAITRAAVFGAIEPMLAAEVETYEIINAGDERVCSLCRHMNGKTYSINHAVDLRDKFLSATSPVEVKTIHPWRSLKQVKDWDQATLAANGMQLPDFHFHCRCDIVAKTFKEYDQPVPMTPRTPRQGSGLPGMNQLALVDSSPSLGGAGKKEIWEDNKGQRYLFKYSTLKYSDKEEPFKAHIQQASSGLASKLYDADKYIRVKVVHHPGGGLGTLQKLEDVEGDLKQINWKSLSSEDWKRIQEEHVLDWSIGNFDSHAGNFIKLKDGRLMGIDKEQAFRYIDDASSWKMSMDYHPNAKYGEQEPLYNTMYRAFAQNQVDLDLQTVLPVIKRLEAIPDDEYKKIFRPYAKALKGNDIEAEKLLGFIVARKNAVRESYRKFFTQLLQERDKSFTGVFKFLDEMTEQEARFLPLAAKNLTKHELSQLTKKDLKLLAKAKKIPYCHYMKEDELIEVLAGTDKAGEILAMVKARTNANIGARLPAKTVEKPEGDIFEDLGVVAKTPYGQAFKKDGQMVEGQQVAVRRFQVDGNLGYQLYFKIPKQFHGDVVTAFAKSGLDINLGRLKFYRGYRDQNSGVFRVSAADEYYRASSTVATGNGIEVYFVHDDRMRAYLGHFEIRIFEPDGKKAAQRVKDFLRKSGLEKIMENPTPEEGRLHRLSVLAWQHRPREEYQLDRGNRSVGQMEAFLKSHGIDPAMADKLIEKEVWPNYRTFINPGMVKEYRDAGGVHLFAGVGTEPERVATIVSKDSPGLMSTLQRYQHGIIGDGSSEDSDEVKGGADNAFVRLVTKNAKGKHKYDDHFKGGGYRLIFDLKSLERCDWYAYNRDSFGSTEQNKYSNRMGALEHIKEVNDDYNQGNEIMFRRGLAKEYIKEIHCNTEWEKLRLIQALKDAGINELNGIKADDLVKVRRVI